MDTAANILFQSISAVYEGTISGNSLYPDLYFSENNKKNYYYGFKLQGLAVSRIIARFYKLKKAVCLDILWLVDDSNINGNGIVTIFQKSGEIKIDGSPNEYIRGLKKDAMIHSCYPDLLNLNDFFDKIIVGSKGYISTKKMKETDSKLADLPTNLFGFSRILLKSNSLTNEKYIDSAINGMLAIIDLVQRSLEKLYYSEPKKEDAGVYCVRCGYKLPNDSYYCAFCGSKQR